MRKLVLMLVAALILGGGSVAAQVATPGPATLPAAAAPFGLGAVAMPDVAEAVEACFARLPATLDGERQQPWVVASDRVQVSWGDADALGHPMALGAIAFAKSDFFPRDVTTGDYVAMQIDSAEGQRVRGGRDGTLAWLRTEITAAAGGDRMGTPTAQRTLYTLVWGEVDGGWMFTAAADTPERLEALVSAFVAAAGAGRHAGGLPPGCLWKIGCICGPIVQTDCTITQ